MHGAIIETQGQPHAVPREGKGSQEGGRVECYSLNLSTSEALEDGEEGGGSCTQVLLIWGVVEFKYIVGQGDLPVLDVIGTE